MHESPKYLIEIIKNSLISKGRRCKGFLSSTYDGYEFFSEIQLQRYWKLAILPIEFSIWELLQDRPLTFYWPDILKSRSTKQVNIGHKQLGVFLKVNFWVDTELSQQEILQKNRGQLNSSTY